MNNINTLVAARVAAIKENSAPVSFEADIPEVIDNLIDNKMYHRKYRKLIRDGHLADLLELAALAAAKDKPSHWFATVCAKARWDWTLKFLAKLRAVRATAERVADQLHTEVNRFIYQQVWRSNSVERWAAMAAEATPTPLRLFAWLCKHGGRPAAPELS